MCFERGGPPAAPAALTRLGAGQSWLNRNERSHAGACAELLPSSQCRCNRSSAPRAVRKSMPCPKQACHSAKETHLKMCDMSTQHCAVGATRQLLGVRSATRKSGAQSMSHCQWPRANSGETAAVTGKETAEWKQARKAAGGEECVWKMMWLASRFAADVTVSSRRST